MFRIAVVIALVACAFAVPVKRRVPIPDGRIVGGNSVSIEDYNYQISLVYYDYHICGGSVISAKYVVTAAHCTQGSSAASLKVRAGSSVVGSGGEVINVKAVNVHPAYDPWNIDNDVSVLELDGQLKYSAAVGEIALAAQNQNFADGILAIVTGWGAISEGGPGSTQLQAVEVPLVNLSDCQRAYASYVVTEQMICAGYDQGGKDACQGDSGGPLVADGVLVGIVSWGYGCARSGYPGVYSSVPALRSYIDEVTSETNCLK